MRYLKTIVMLGFLCWAADVSAQVSSGLSSMPEQWQLTLDVIKTKAQTLLIKNNEIKSDYRRLSDQALELQQAVIGQQNKIEAIRLFLNERHGRTDQQIQIEQLQQGIKIKRQQDKESQEQLWALRKKQARQEQETRAVPPPLPQPELNEQLSDLRQRLEEEKKQEVILENKLSVLRSPAQAPDQNADRIEEQNKQLSMRLQELRDQKRVLQARLPDAARAMVNQQKYAELKKRKEQLEADINAYAYRMDQLKESSLLTTMPWPVEKKKLIHVMVQKDARNNQLREKIKMLREDVEILKDQVAKFERRVNFMQGQNKTP
jgi:hypothetical protein